MSKSNVRQGDGAGATAGFRGGRGRPGYPLPDSMKGGMEETETGVIEKTVDSIISKLTGNDGMVSSGASREVVEKQNPLDLVVWDAVCGLVGEERKKGEDLGFGFNEDGFPLQDRYEFQELPVSVENKRGSIRHWYDEDGNEKGSTEMYFDYGYIDGYVGADGEPVDVYVGPTEDAGWAYVVHQNKAPDFEEYDEDKVMLGFPSEEAARESYKRQYNDERFYGGMSSMPMDTFKSKLRKGGKITNESRLRETAETPKSIAHLEDLKPEEFMSFLKKIVDMPGTGGLEVSEKIDGSAKITFVRKADQVWAQSKNGSLKKNPGEWPDQPMFEALRKAHEALLRGVSKLPEDQELVGDILYTRVPNTIEYGPNAIVVHSAKIKKTDLGDGWTLENNPSIDIKDSGISVTREYESIRDLYERLKVLEPNRLKGAGRGPYKAALETFRNAQKAVKKKLLPLLHKRKSAFGPEGGNIEGLVLKDLESGAMTKLVDKEYFTKLNKFMWKYRELLASGASTENGWEIGVLQGFRNSVLKDVLGLPGAGSPTFVSQVQKFAEKVSFPPEASTPQKKLDHVLSSYISGHARTTGEDAVGSFRKELGKAWEAFEKLRERWDSEKGGDIAFHHRDGNTSRSIRMDPIIKQRTDAAFKEVEGLLNGVEGSLEALRGDWDDLTKRTAILKIVLGQGRLDKIQAGLPDKVKENLIKELDASLRTPLLGVVKGASSKLKGRGIQLGKELGEGNNGIVFDIGGGKVLKVTEDPDEAQSSFNLLGKNLKRVARFYDVFRFPKSEEGDYFGIVQERLRPLSPGDEAEITRALKVLNRYLQPGWEVEWDRSRDILSNFVRANPELKDEIESSVGVIEKFKLTEIHDELAKHDIDWMDMHEGNLMMRGDQVVAVDLGTSDSPEKVVPTLESNLREDESPHTTDAVIDAFSDRLLAKGIDAREKKSLGSGYNGTAYDVGGGKVLKITTDQFEARAANHLKGKKLRHVVHIFDVFAFPTTTQKRWYGIVEELATPLSQQEKATFNKAAGFVIRKFKNHNPFTVESNTWVLPWKDVKKAVMGGLSSASEGHEAEQHLKNLEDIGLPDVLDDLSKNRIGYGDVHADNFMRRGGDLIVVDLGGHSASPGKIPDVLEGVVGNVLGALREARADQVGVTVGRFQPFHKGHAEVIRNLARKFSKVLVIVAGNTKDQRNPFSYDLRVDMIKRSLPDVMSKVELHKAEAGGKGSGFVPGVLSDIVKNKRSSLEADVAVQILVGNDRVEEIRKQVEHARKAKEKGTEMYFDPNMATVGSIPDVKNDDEADRISGSRVREALVQGDKDVVKSLMDPHLVSNPGDFEEIYAKMKKELEPEAPARGPDEIVEDVIDEVIGDIGGEEGVMEILQANRDRLEKSKWNIQVDNLKRLGGGQEGIAFDMGGGRVLKVTADPKEAKTSLGLVGKTNNRHVVHIFDVFAFPVLAQKAPTRPSTISGQGGKHPAYGIVTEKLTPLSPAEIKEFNDFVDEMQAQMGRQEYIDAIWTSDWEGFMRKMSDSFVADIAKEAGPNFGPRHQRVLQTRMQRYRNFFEKFKVPEMMKELKSAGIKFADYHGDNLMKRGSEYVINDLGRSESPSKSEPKKLGESVEGVVHSVVVEAMAFSGPGNTAVGVQAGSSAVSSFKNQVDPNTEELWQNQLKRLKIRGQSHLPEGSLKQDIPEGVWIPWSSETGEIQFDEKAHSLSGRGELKFAAELALRGYPVSLTGQTKSYDIQSDVRYEVKELGDIRIEKTGIESVHELFSYLRKLVDILEESLSEIDKEMKPTGDFLEPHGLTVPQLKAFIEMVKVSFKTESMPLGLLGLNKKKSKFPVSFRMVADSLQKFLDTARKTKKKHWIGSYLDQEMDDAHKRAIARYIGRMAGQPYEKALDVNEVIIVGANLAHNGLTPDDVTFDSIQKRYMQAFDPSRVLGDVDRVVVVDKDKGFFVFDKSKIPEYFRPMGISKSTPKFSPNEKLRGTVSRKKKEPKQREFDF